MHDKTVIGLSSQFIFKEAYSTYSKQAWNPHQDNYYPNNKKWCLFNFNWFLKDADKENGTIYCYPGSHKLGLLDAKDNVSFREKVNTNPGRNVYPEEFKDKKKDLIILVIQLLFFTEIAYMALIRIILIDLDHGFPHVIYLKEKNFL